MSMCCWQEKHQVDDVITFDHPRLQQLRVESQQRIPASCSSWCSVSGHVNNERERSLKEFQELYPNTDNERLQTLHLEQGLICNLECVSCGSMYSSAWNRNYQLFDPAAPQVTLTRYPQEKWKHLDFQDLKRIHFTGGEPLLNRDNGLILEHLDREGVLSNVVLNYSTNGTIFPDENTLRLWRKSRFVRLYFSLDACGSVFEYTRYPARWIEVVNNINRFCEQQDICIIIGVTLTVGIHNIFSMSDFFDWWESDSRLGSQGDPATVYVRKIEPWSYGGKVLDLANLDPEQAGLAQQSLDSLKIYPGIQDIIQYIATKSHPTREWQTYLERLDAMRGTNWRDSLAVELQKETSC